MELKSPEELTEMQKDFIGKEFSTPKGGTLKVVGKTIEDNKFVVECTLCSGDVELFPEGFSISKGKLLRGTVPCGCSTSKKLSSEQYIVILTRECMKRGYEFKGFYENFKGVKTKVVLYNPETGVTWNTSSIDNLLRGHGDIVEWKVKSRSEQNICWGNKINTVLVKNNIDTYTIKDEFKTRDTKISWVCKNGHDRITTISNFIQREARCTLCKPVVGTRSDLAKSMEKVDSILSGENHKLLGLSSDYIGTSKTKVDWVCSKGHKNSTTFSKIFSGRRCKICKFDNVALGFNPKRSDETDYLYAYKIEPYEGNPYIKVGRTFRLVDREIENQNRIDRYYNGNVNIITPLFILSGDHKKVFNSEKKVLNNLYTLDVKNTYGSSECLSIIDIGKVFDICIDSGLKLFKDYRGIL